MSYVIPSPVQPSVEVKGTADRFPVHRIYCVGRNYAAHAREMGNDDREPPFFFTQTCRCGGGERGGSAISASRTSDFHHEVELVVALGSRRREHHRPQGEPIIFGYAVGIDLTRRDLQSDAREEGRPWDHSKGFDRSAPIGAIHPRQEHGRHRARVASG